MNQSIFLKVFLILLLVITGLSACSKEEEPIVENPSISVDEDDSGVELSIPDSYTHELVPIYPNAHLYSVVESNQSYTIMFYSKDEVEDVMDFYKNVFRDAENKMETIQTGSYTSYGELDGYTYTIDVSEDSDLEGYQTLVILGVVMNQK